MKKFSTKHLILAVIILLSILGGCHRHLCHGKWPLGYNDPVEYIATARSLDAGQGLGYVQGHGRFSPIRIHPPFYSLLMAAIGLFKGNLIVASRWLNISAFVASIFLAGWIFYRYSRAPALGILTSALLLTFPNMIWMYSSAYSEPLFILLIVSGGLCLVAYLHRERLSLLVTSAILIGLIALTRYAGIAMIMAGAMGVLLFASGENLGPYQESIPVWFTGEPAGPGLVDMDLFHQRPQPGRAQHRFGLERIGQSVSDPSGACLSIPWEGGFHSRTTSWV